MKILLWVPEFPPYHVGGGGPVFEALAHEYAKLWHKVIVVYGYYPTKTWFEKIKEYVKDWIQYIQVPLLPTPAPLSFLKTVLPTFPWNIQQLTKIIETIKPDRAHLHGYGLLFINQLAKILRDRKIPYIYTLHGAPVSADKKWWIIKMVYNFYKKTRGKAILENACDITAVSQYTIDNFSEFFPYRDKIRVVHNWIYPEEFEKRVWFNIYDRFNLSKDATIYLSIGRIEWLKGFDQFIKMIPLLVKSWVDARYFIAGRDNGFKEELDKLIRELGVEDRVFYLWFISWDEKLSALQNGNYLVVPSYTESFGITVLEALASWLLPVVNSVWGLKELIKDNRNGRSIDFSNVNNYVYLMNCSIPKQSLQNDIQQYNWEKIAIAYLS